MSFLIIEDVSNLPSDINHHLHPSWIPSCISRVNKSFTHTMLPEISWAQAPSMLQGTVYSLIKHAFPLNLNI